MKANIQLREIAKFYRHLYVGGQEYAGVKWDWDWQVLPWENGVQAIGTGIWSLGMGKNVKNQK